MEQDSKIFRPMIHQEEWKQIYDVIRRDGKLRQTEMFRLRKIEDQLKEEVVVDDNSAASCFRCGSSFNFLFRKRLLCVQCQRVVCQRCVNNTSDGKAWLCNYCEKLRILQAQTNFFQDSPTSPQNLESDTELESDSGYDPTTHSLCSRESSLRYRKPLLGIFSSSHSQSEGGPSFIRVNGPDLPNDNCDNHSDEIRDHIETLVERIINDNLENAKLQRIYDHSECLLIRQQRVALIVYSFQLALEQPSFSSSPCGGGGLYQPLTEGSTPTCAHSRLKEIVDEVLEEVTQLPCMEDCVSNSDLLSPMENEWTDTLYSQSYEDILATAVLNKVIEQHQRKNFSNISNGIVSELVTPVTPETPISPITPVSPITPSRDDKNIQTEMFVSKGVQSDLNEDGSESDAGTESAGDDFSWADKRNLQPVSYTIEEQIEEITTTIEDSESETETTTTREKSSPNKKVVEPVVTKTTATDSGLPDLNFFYAELNFDEGKKVPFPELGVDVVEPTNDQVDATNKDVSVLISDVESWEDNWRFRKKNTVSPYSNVRGRIVVCDEPVPMLIPNPEDRLVRTRIGSQDIDELSDLSEKNSDDSLDVSTSDTDSEMCFRQSSPYMGKKKTLENDEQNGNTRLNDLNKDTPRQTPSPKPTPLPRRNKNLITTTTDAPFVLHSPPRSSTDTSSRTSIPEFSQQLQDVEVVEGNAAIFTCKVLGNPEPHMKWYLEGHEIVPSKHVHIINLGSGSWTVELLSVSLASSGSELMVVASNRLGQSTSSAYLNVVAMKKEVQSLTKRVNSTQDQVHIEAEKMLISTNQLSELSRQLDNVDNTITRLEVQFQQRTWEERQAEIQRDALHNKLVEQTSSTAIRQLTGQALDIVSAAQDVIDRESFAGSIAEREHKKWLNPTGVIPNNPYSSENLVKRVQNGRHGLSPVRTCAQIPVVQVDEFDGKPVDLSRDAETDNTNLEGDCKEYRRDYFVNADSELHSNNIAVDVGTRNSLNLVEEKVYVRAGKMSYLDDKVRDLESQVEKIKDTTPTRRVCDLEDKVVYAAAQITHNENQLSIVETQVNRLQHSIEVNNSQRRVQRSFSDRSSTNWQPHVSTGNLLSPTETNNNRWTSLQTHGFRTGSLERLNTVGQKTLKTSSSSSHSTSLSKKFSTSVSCLYRPPSTDTVCVSTRNVRDELPNLPSVKEMVFKYQEGITKGSSSQNSTLERKKNVISVVDIFPQNANDQSPVMEARNIVILDNKGSTKREVTGKIEDGEQHDQMEASNKSPVVRQLSKQFEREENVDSQRDKTSYVKRVHSLTARTLCKEFREAAQKNSHSRTFKYPVTSGDSDESLSPDGWFTSVYRPSLNFTHMNGNVNGEWGQISPDTDGHGYTSDESGASTVSLPRYRLPVTNNK